MAASSLLVLEYTMRDQTSIESQEWKVSVCETKGPCEYSLVRASDSEECHEALHHYLA